MGFGDWAFPVLLSKNVTLAFEGLVTEIRYRVGPLLLLGAWGFR
jgi:hypothetical protein